MEPAQSIERYYNIKLLNPSRKAKNVKARAIYFLIKSAQGATYEILSVSTGYAKSTISHHINGLIQSAALYKSVRKEILAIAELTKTKTVIKKKIKS
jgi:hypothetical protein